MRVGQDIVRSQIIDPPSFYKIIASATFWQMNECFTKRFLTVSCGSLYRHPWGMTRSVCTISAQCDSFKGNLDSGQEPLWTIEDVKCVRGANHHWINFLLKSACHYRPIGQVLLPSCPGRSVSLFKLWEKRLNRHFQWADYSIGPLVNGHSQDTSQCHSTSAHSDAFRYGTQGLIDYHPVSY